MLTVTDIYNEIDSSVPFSAAESWDNSGILAGCPDGQVTRIITCLDITEGVIAEAAKAGAQLIVSHHPVIFHPLKSVYTDSPVGMLLRSGISAICVHTPFDMAPCGMNMGLYELLSRPLGLVPDSAERLEDMGNGLAIGRIYHLSASLTPAECAGRLKDALGCPSVRYTCGKERIDRIAVCSGAGGSLAELARKKGADAIVTGDLKHDTFIWAENYRFCLFDCGHYYTEKIFAPMMRRMLSRAFPSLVITESEAEKDVSVRI